MMARCIELSRYAPSQGEYPFASVVVLDGQIVAEAINRSIRDRDLSRHAEVVALSQAQKTIGQRGLTRCTLYSNVEPCAMCCFCIRESWIRRVVYSLGSPEMGGVSKWNILRDEALSKRLPQAFDAVPEVVSGVLSDEAEQAWRDWNPVLWEIMKSRGVLIGTGQGGVGVKPAHRRSLLQQLQTWVMRGRPRRDASAPDLGSHTL
jgi:tRNA(adenine34) deaminase